MAYFFPTTLEQETILQERFQSSLREMCFRFKWDYNETEKTIFENLKYVATKRFKDAGPFYDSRSSESQITEDAWRSLEAQTESPNLWEIIAIQQAESQFLLAERLSKVILKIPVNKEYLERLLSDIDPELGFEYLLTNIQSFLTEIPHVYRFDLTFHASVGPESVLGTIPCININHILPVAFQTINAAICQIMIEFNNDTVNFKDTQDIASIAKQPENIAMVKSALAMLFGSSITTSIPNVNPTFNKHSSIIASIYSTAIEFVFFHEFGHVLWGHFDVGPCQDIEFEADSFATIALGMLAQEEDTLLATMTTIGGISLVIVVLEILEVYFSLKCNTHPTSRQRLANIISGYENPEINKLYNYFTNTFTKVLNPALFEGWEFQIQDFKA